MRASDQWHLNTVLLNDARRSLRIGDPQPAFRTVGGRGPTRRPQSFRLPLGRRAGERVQRLLQRRRTRWPFHALLRICRLLFILTSEHVIHGRFSDGLRVGVIPMSVVARVFIEGGPPSDPARLLVLHRMENKDVVPTHRPRTSTPPALVRWWYATARRRD